MGGVFKEMNSEEHIFKLDIIERNRKVRSKPIKYVVDESTGCWVCVSHFTSKTSQYPRNILNGKRYTVSRLILKEVLGRRLDDFPQEVARHKCDNPKCINPDHIEVGTTLDNVMDKMSRGRGPCGHRSGVRKLSEADVIEIKKLLINGHANRDIAKKFNVSQGNISSINTGSTWKDVKVEGFKINTYGNNRKLTGEDIKMINSMISSGEYTHKNIASEFSISPSLVSKMKREMNDNEE